MVQSTQTHTYDYTYTQNRDLSWLCFNERVLEEAHNPTLPILERLIFSAIFMANLDEWFMVRIGLLLHLLAKENTAIDDKTPYTTQEILDLLYVKVEKLLKEHETMFAANEKDLQAYGITRKKYHELCEEEKCFVDDFFTESVHIKLKPKICTQRTLAAHLDSANIYVVAKLHNAALHTYHYGLVSLPKSLQRIVPCNNQANPLTYILLEDVIRNNLTSCFTGYDITDIACMRIMRSADISIDDFQQHAQDPLLQTQDLLRQRKSSELVRLDIQSPCSQSFLDEIVRCLQLKEEFIHVSESPIDVSYITGLKTYVKKGLSTEIQKHIIYPDYSVQKVFKKKEKLLKHVFNNDTLFYFPYNTMDNFFDLIRACIETRQCQHIYISLYRIAKHSKLCKLLEKAARLGISVHVLVELRARFDESNNLHWIERLKAAGCDIIQIPKGYKCHAKVAQFEFENSKKEKYYISCIGTGNFNEITAQTYSDILFCTSDQRIGQDVSLFFSLLKTHDRMTFHTQKLIVSPISLKETVKKCILEQIQRAVQGKPARICMKLNALTDREIIDLLAQASQKDVYITLIVRGICCILPHIKNKTEHIQIFQIVGRFLEHTRIYAFGPKLETIYIASADMMTRNTERRFEVACPIENLVLKKQIIAYLTLQLCDTQLKRQLSPEGRWVSPYEDPYFVKDEHTTLLPSSTGYNGSLNSQQICMNYSMQEKDNAAAR